MCNSRNTRLDVIIVGVGGEEMFLAQVFSSLTLSIFFGLFCTYARRAEREATNLDARFPTLASLRCSQLEHLLHSTHGPEGLEQEEAAGDA